MVDQRSRVVICCISDFSSSWSFWPCWLRLAESLLCRCSTRRSVDEHSKTFFDRSSELTNLAFSSIAIYRINYIYTDRGHSSHGMERSEPGIKKYHSKTGNYLSLKMIILILYYLSFSLTAVAGKVWRILLVTVSPLTTVVTKRWLPQSAGLLPGKFDCHKERMMCGSMKDASCLLGVCNDAADGRLLVISQLTQWVGGRLISK